MMGSSLGVPSTLIGGLFMLSIIVGVWIATCTEPGNAPKEAKNCSCPDTVWLTFYYPNLSDEGDSSVAMDDFMWKGVSLIRGNFVRMNIQTCALFGIGLLYTLPIVTGCVVVIVTFFQIIKFLWSRGYMDGRGVLETCMIMLAIRFYHNLPAYLGIEEVGVAKNESALEVVF